VLVSEGALKGDLISHFLSVPVIAAAGVSLFGRDFADTLSAKYPGLSVVICFDSDWRTKSQVLSPLIALQRQLTHAGIPSKIRWWPREYRGYDDYLLAVAKEQAA
jgi:hypothetical protein